MEKNPFKKLINLDIKLCMLQLRGEQIREPFEEMMKRKQERHSLLLDLENGSRELWVGLEQLKKEIKEHETYLKFYSETLTSWDFSIDQRNEFYQQWNLSDVLKIENNKKRRAFLNSFPDMEETLQFILQTLENLMVIQQVIIARLEESVNTDNEARISSDQRLINLN